MEIINEKLEWSSAKNCCSSTLLICKNARYNSHHLKGLTYLGVDQPANSEDIQEHTDHKLSGESFHFYFLWYRMFEVCSQACYKKGKLFRVW